MPRKYRIAVLSGDGIGPEVIRESLRVLRACESLLGINLEITEYSAGAEYWLKNGRKREWDGDTFDRCRDADSILMGAIGLPDITYPDGNPVGGQVVFGLRRGLDLYANVRPVHLMEGVDSPVSTATPQTVDLIIVRENTEDLYSGIQGILSRGGLDEAGVDVRLVTRKGSERIVQYAFTLAVERHGAPMDGRKRVTCVDKSNVLAGCRLFRKVFSEAGRDFPQIERDYAYVDAMTQWLVRRPGKYDVVVTTNMFGDILSDLGAVVQGGLGFASSANIGDDHGLFEPVHGSAPTHAGKNTANPVAAILSARMMLEWLAKKKHDKKLAEASKLVETAVASSLRERLAPTRDLGGRASTREAGEAVVRKMQQRVRRSKN